MATWLRYSKTTITLGIWEVEMERTRVSQSRTTSRTKVPLRQQVSRRQDPHPQSWPLRRRCQVPEEALLSKVCLPASPDLLSGWCAIHPSAWPPPSASPHLWQSRTPCSSLTACHPSCQAPCYSPEWATTFPGFQATPNPWQPPWPNCNPQTRCSSPWRVCRTYQVRISLVLSNTWKVETYLPFVSVVTL